jgi:hypothetical protein
MVVAGIIGGMANGGLVALPRRVADGRRMNEILVPFLIGVMVAATPLLLSATGLAHTIFGRGFSALVGSGFVGIPARHRAVEGGLVSRSRRQAPVGLGAPSRQLTPIGIRSWLYAPFIGRCGRRLAHGRCDILQRKAEAAFPAPCDDTIDEIALLFVGPEYTDRGRVVKDQHLKAGQNGYGHVRDHCLMASIGNPGVWSYSVNRTIRSEDRGLAVPVIGADGDFAEPAGDIEDIGWPGKAGDATPQRCQQRPPLVDRHVKTRGARCGVQLVQIVRLDPSGQHRAEQGLQCGGVVVHPPQ